MLETLMAEVEAQARRVAGRRRDQLAQRLASDVPPDVVVQADPDAVVVSVRGLRRRLALDPALRWLFAGGGR